MQYAVLIYQPADAYASLTEDEQAAVTEEYLELTRDPHVTGGARLEGGHTATTVRIADGTPLTTDGPFADTKEVFAGYYLLDAANLDDALAFAGKIPAARLGGAIEVRPIAAVTP